MAKCFGSTFTLCPTSPILLCKTSSKEALMAVVPASKSVWASNLGNQDSYSEALNPDPLPRRLL